MKQIVIVHGGSSFNSYENYLDSLKNSPLHIRTIALGAKMARMAGANNNWLRCITAKFPKQTECAIQRMENIFRKTIAATRQRRSVGRL